MLCIPENYGGKGGVAGGAGSEGQASQSATGHGSGSYGYPVIDLTTGMTVTETVQLTKDYSGTLPADLSSITKVEYRARPTMRSNSREFVIDCPFTADGVVTINFTPDELDNNNGVWYAEFLTYEGDKLVGNYRSYLCIRKGMTGSKNGPNTITAMDVRLAVMDTSPEANQLIDDLEFSDMMIYHAIERAVDEWDETPPQLEHRFDATTFPWKEHLIKGAVGFLMQEVAYRYNRNRMQYSASGITLDTNDKGPQYIAQAQAARAEWKSFVAAKKTELNMNECFGTFSLPYFGNRCGWW